MGLCGYSLMGFIESGKKLKLVGNYADHARAGGLAPL